MSSIEQVRGGMLAQMQALAGAAEGQPIKAATAENGPVIGASFITALRAVDAEQHQAASAMTAVDSGNSEDLVGAMVQSQKASVSFSALLQVRNKLTTAFDDIMRMPL
ncbi:flagellar hook-basal body complex protein FliE [Pseudomonas sp. Marseille-QA0892]